jgi:chromatin assembly factor 1 subunit A
MLATILISKTLEANTSVSVDAVAAKIKLLAARTQYLSHFPTSSSNLDSNNSCEVDIFNDNTVSNMWRWELVSLDLLSETKKKTAKMAQKARKKLNYHFKAILKLIQSIDKYEHGLTSKNKSSVNFQKRVAEISTAEENVLKYEREALNNRIKRRTTMQKEKEKEVQKHKIKEEAEKKLREKAELEAEKDRKKYEASKKQKARMLSFFSTSSAKPKQQSAISSNSSIPDSSEDCTTKKEFDGKQFWEQLGTGSIANKEMFSKLSRGAIQSRRRKTKKVTARVFATVVPENPFEQQPYDEERFIEIWNRNKYLSFHEDFRPPYHGTWTKPRSSIITGRNPFGKDLSFLNYEIDSEAEWEEDDNEQGDDCSNMDNDDDELDGDEDTTKYNYQDGWLAQDGDLALDEDDEETLAIHKNNVSVKNVTDTSTSHKMTSRCIIAPLFGGLPQTSNYINLASDLVEGVTNEEAEKILAYHEGETLLPKVSLCLDLFPPLTENEKKLVNKKYENASKKTNQDMSDEDMKIFAKFVHNCTLKSKELVVEELRQAHRKIISSRAQAHRKLDLIANKRRLEKGAGVIWEVKDDVLKSLGLSELLVSEHNSIVVKTFT